MLHLQNNIRKNKHKIKISVKISLDVIGGGIVVKRFSVLVAIMVVFSIFTVPVSALGAPLEEIKKLVSTYYVGDVPSDLQQATTIDTIIQQLDPYSTYFTQEEFEEYTNSINNTTTGIGVVIEENEQGILIVNTFEGGAASAAGFEAGDIILSVDGNLTKDMSVQQASSLITGKEGTTVQISLLKSTNVVETYTLTRTKFQIPIVTKQLLYGNIGYISFNSFSDNGAALVLEAKEALTLQGATSFILDLMNNGGGYVDTAEDLIGLFPNSPNAYNLLFNGGEELFLSSVNTSLFPPDTKVLVNGYSASASEMTAAALLDQKSATLYGQQTYGKGSMQSFFSLSDGSYLKLTVAHFTGPNGTIVNEAGVTPNVITEEGRELAKAHQDAILLNYHQFNNMTALENVPETKEFTVTFSDSIADNLQTQKIELVKLGGKSIPVSLKQKSDTQYVITPNETLEKGAAYLLLIHPTFQSQSGKMMKHGVYVEVTVQP